MNVLTTMLQLFFAMAIGFVMRKKGVIDHNSNKMLSFIVVNISAPILAVTSVANADGDKSAVLKFMAVGFIFYLCLPLLGKLVAKVLRAPESDKAVYELSVVFGNNVFMGFPVVTAIFGPSAIFYSYIFNIMFNFMYYSYGINLITRGSDTLSDQTKLESLKKCINNGTIAALISLIMFFFDLQLPVFANDVLNFIGNLATPLSMIAIGSSMASFPFSRMLENKKILAIIPIRLIMMPILAYIVMTLTGFDGMLRGIITVTFGMPVASMVSMGCTEYECHEEEASTAVVASTVISIITIPILMIMFS